jgi:ADP-L-glycero-D-manno-heptose 6-epimerase
MIVITGAAGFIGSCLTGRLNREGLDDLVLVDDFSRADKERNLQNKSYHERVDREVFFSWLEKHEQEVGFIVHLGARTDTTEFDRSVFERLNTGYSRSVWKACSSYCIPLIYASSAATYGLGEQGFDDDHGLIPSLQPLNPYGESKNEFDKWMLGQETRPPYWAGLKFFNVYGPNEYHKGRMASVVLHAHEQIVKTGKMRLFRSHRRDFGDGMQKRDFIYVGDVLDVILFLMTRRPPGGIFNVGTGRARTFLDLARALFNALGKRENIEFIDTPADIRDKYQYFTEARMEKLRSAGYASPFVTLEEGARKYAGEYLHSGKIY